MTSHKTDEHVLVASVGDSAAGGCFPGWIWFVVVVLVARRCRKGVDGERDPLAIRWLGSSMAGEQTKSEWLKTETQVGIFKRGMNWMKKEAEVRIEIGFSWKSSSKFVMRMRIVFFFFFGASGNLLSQLAPVWFLCWNPSGFRISWKDPKLSAECELRSCQQLGHEAVKLELLDYELWKWCENDVKRWISRWFRGTYASWAADLPNVAPNYAVAAVVLELGSHGFFPLFGHCVLRWVVNALSWMSGWSWGLSRCYRSVWSNWNCEMNCRRGVHRRCTKLYPGIPVSSKTWRHARVWAMVKSEVGLDPGRPINDIVSNSTGTEQKISWGLYTFRLVSV